MDDEWDWDDLLNEEWPGASDLPTPTSGSPSETESFDETEQDDAELSQPEELPSEELPTDEPESAPEQPAELPDEPAEADTDEYDIPKTDLSGVPADLNGLPAEFAAHAVPEPEEPPEAQLELPDAETLPEPVYQALAEDAPEFAQEREKLADEEALDLPVPSLQGEPDAFSEAAADVPQEPEAMGGSVTPDLPPDEWFDDSLPLPSYEEPSDRHLDLMNEPGAYSSVGGGDWGQGGIQDGLSEYTVGSKAIRVQMDMPPEFEANLKDSLRQPLQEWQDSVLTATGAAIEEQSLLGSLARISD